MQKQTQTHPTDWVVFNHMPTHSAHTPTAYSCGAAARTTLSYHKLAAAEMPHVWRSSRVYFCAGQAAHLAHGATTPCRDAELAGCTILQFLNTGTTHAACDMPLYARSLALPPAVGSGVPVPLSPAASPTSSPLGEDSSRRSWPGSGQEMSPPQQQTLTPARE